MNDAVDAGPLAFFQAQHGAFVQTLEHARADDADPSVLVRTLLSQAIDSYERNAELQAEGGPALDCGRGCAACCSLRVTATTPEVLLVAQFLRAVQPGLLARGIDLMARLAGADRHTAGLTEAERLQRREPCPFVAQGACVIYPVRPLSCRGHASHDRRACVDAMAGRSTEVPCSLAHMTVRSLVQNAMQSALRDAGMAWGMHELNGALQLAMARPDAEAAWLRGEDPLAAARVHEVDADEMARTFDQLKPA
ncbi:putative zinc- or iron-chelating protein [Sphaerotilus hippei]|uniref:Putative zinc-or iron-chelating protein n=1 Tax=Sphaerotilus hippei TaxID=744406 RepID=A0A318GZX1_9BURK|nr:YkgJ family cysteine cluster protein [Sphaerotilus hippei]PXW94376.1 putative zinc- or iron-chelating protein [Sphaerotilus hippei]